MDWKVPLADLDYGEEEKQAVLDVLQSRWLTMGAVTQEFEQEFARFLGVKHALAVSNATVALHLACLALGIGPGDEVIVPSLTFVATSNAVLYTGAQVRFADIISPEELNISPEAIERQITPRTKAVIVVHYGGYPCCMEAIREIADHHSLAVIEDAAHAPGAVLSGKPLGTWGDIGCFSFFSNKNLSTGEGGMLVTEREDIAEKVRVLRSHGMTSLTWDRHQGHAYSYDVIGLGYNYRIDEIRSALGLVQLRKLTANNARRKAITQQYWQQLEGSGLGLPFFTMYQCERFQTKQSPPEFEEIASSQSALLSMTSQSEPAYHIFPILLPARADRLKFIEVLRSQGVQTSIHYPPIHQFTYYQERFPGIMLPRTEAVAAREVTLPLYPGMGEAQVGAVVEAVQKALQP